MQNHNGINIIDKLVKQLSNEKDDWMSLAIAIDLADEIMKWILPKKDKWMNMLERDSQDTGSLPSPLPMDVFHNQKQRTWFHEHPESSSARAAFQHFKQDDCVVESKFFWFSEGATKQKISASTEFTSNWEDSDLTRIPSNKVGIDFFLTSDANSLLIVLSNRKKLRVMELHDHLSNTQKQIFEYNLLNAAEYDSLKNNDYTEPQQIIHSRLWNALQLKEVNKQFYSIIAKFFDDLVKTIGNQGKNSEDAKQFSSRLLGRMLFIWFLRKMNIIHEEFGYFDLDDLSATEYYDKKIKLLFFNTLNTDIPNRIHSDHFTPYLNGGLFEPKDNDFVDEMISFPENYFKQLFDKFSEFNFTTDESSADFEMIAVDPEMLGQVFENLLASQNEDTGQSARKSSGAFYTPRDIVAFICKESLREYLYSKVENKTFHQGIDLLIDYSDAEFLARKSTSGADLWGINSKTVTQTILEALDNFKVIDPACGSGAFPMGMIQLLVRSYERLLKSFDPYELKLSIIENNIFGVDIEPMAIEISRLRAWLSVIIDEPDKTNIKPLPNLDFKFVCANSLVSLSKDDETIFDDQDLDVKLSDIRQKYFNARVKSSKDNWQRKYYELTTGKIELWESVRSEQLKSFDPFIVKKPASFFDSFFMFGVHKFDAVIGNPPYVGTKKRSAGDKKALENEFGFADDLYNHFFFKGINLLKEGGSLAYITSKTFWTIQSKKNLRDLLLSNTVNYIFDTANPFESAMVDTAITSVTKNPPYTNNTIKFLDGSKNLMIPVLFEVEQSTYINTQNTVIFKPTKQNLKIYELYGQKIKELNNMWWDKISTSRKIEQNKKELNEYRSNLKPGDITLLGCLTDGGVGLQTGNNGNYIAVRKSTKWAENILKTRPKKLKNAISKYNIPTTDLNGFSNPEQLLNELDEYQIAELFDSLKEKYGRDIFGQGYLYRIINDKDIVDVDSLTEDEKTNGISTEKNHYVPYDKGDKDGNRWFLETPFAIAWSKENVSYLKTDPRARYQGYTYFFKEGFCWSDINTTYLKCRAKQKSINDVKSMSLYGLSDQVPEYYIISIINSKFMSQYVDDFVNNTQTFQINDARQLPIVVPSPAKLQELLPLFQKAVLIKKSGNTSQEDNTRALELIEDNIEDIIREIYQMT
ncbi:Eco57I restriction-modification methylase domain-containing protein [Streptococcus salivarius]|jgi:type IIS restriction endonuclease, putative|uniref:Eco57I restriction-modification methylase domain-containing protein n=1 Tax=Streptococcus salivarius TaxID=1304 RepID=UPI001642A5F2|nr:Eco57I restriction-modification methylase domain-containing protein [Streptococcus salivarius]